MIEFDRVTITPPDATTPVLEDVMTIYYPHGCVGSVEEFEQMARGEYRKHSSQQVTARVVYIS